MKVLFAVSNEEISEKVVKKYQQEYKEIISYKNVYYFNAILKEIQKDKSYDRIVISEELESFSHTQYEQIDKFIFDKLDSISDEASNIRGNDIPIILICSDRRAKGEQMLIKLFGIGIYNAIIGNDRGIEEVCKLINRPRLKKEAKSYYKIDVEEVNYHAENENDVSEMEIQNILAHYKSLGKNEDRYIDSFNNIAAQYNDTQLRIISKFLPLNVRAVLEEKSPKYQQIMSFNNSVANSLRYNKNQEKDGPSEKLLKPKTKNMPLTKPVVIPSAVNMVEAKKLTKAKTISVQPEVEEIVQVQAQTQNVQYRSNVKEYEQDQKEIKIEPKVVKQVPENISEIQKNDVQPVQTAPVKRGRGRPKKVLESEEQKALESTPKRGRGRPKKEIPNENPNLILPGFENIENDDIEDEDILNEDKNIIQEDIVMPKLEQEVETIMPGIEEELDVIVPGLEDESNNIMSEVMQETEIFMPEIEEKTTLPGLDINRFEDQKNNYSYQDTKNEQMEELYTSENETIKKNNNYIPTKDLTNLMTSDKKIVTFVGTSKNGTSFIVNHVAQLLSSMGINTAILDATTNKNSYYIYTKNEEELRNTAIYSLENLVRGVDRGIKVNRNLTVFTSLSDERNLINNVDDILETLLKNYSLILIDCDFDSPVGYFKNSNETYLVQSLDVLTIQPLTAFLRELKGKNILDEKKLRIILNKYV